MKIMRECLPNKAASVLFVAAYPMVEICQWITTILLVEYVDCYA